MAYFVFDNPLILSEILSSLPPRDLKNVRLVSKEWNKESSKWFYAKVKVPFDFGCTRWEPLVAPYWPFYNNKNVSVAIKLIPSAVDYTGRKCSEEEFFLNLKSFFQNNGKHVRSLDLKMDATNLHALMSELRSLRNLGELNLAVNLQETSEDEVAEFGRDSAEGLPNVEKLTFDFIKGCVSRSYIWGRENGKKYEEFFKNVVKMLPSLSWLVLGTAEFDQCGATEILDILKRNPKLVEKLSGISIRSYRLTSGSVCFSHCQKILNLPFKTPLKRLEMGKLDSTNECYNISDDEDEVRHPPKDPPALAALMEKFSESLEHLSLEIENANSQDEIDVADLLTYKIPSLPKLKTLELTAFEEDCEYKVTDEPTEHSWFNFTNPDGLGGVTNRIDYGVMFPQLKTLIFKDPHDNDYKPRKLFANKTMRPFIPRVGDVKCESLRKLVLPHLYQDSSNPEYREWLTRLTEIFPNVHSPMFRAARAGIWHDSEKGDELPEDSDKDVSSSDDGGNSSDESDS